MQSGAGEVYIQFVLVGREGEETRAAAAVRPKLANATLVLFPQTGGDVCALPLDDQDSLILETHDEIRIELPRRGL